MIKHWSCFRFEAETLSTSLLFLSHLSTVIQQSNFLTWYNYLWPWLCLEAAPMITRSLSHLSVTFRTLYFFIEVLLKSKCFTTYFHDGVATILGAIWELSRSVQPMFKILKFGEGVRSFRSSSSLADPTCGCDTCQEVQGFPPSLWAKQVLCSHHDWTSSGLFLWALIHLECSENFF
jgi:hypothetical protein